MTLYESNIQYIKKQYPSLLSILEYEGEKSIEPILTRNGEPNLKITKNDRSYYLHSRYHAREDARKWVQSIENEIIEVKHILIIGVGLGYYLEELLTICKHKDIFILEPSTEIFIEWLKTRNVTNVLSNSQIRLMAVGENEYLPLQISSEIARFILGDLKMIVPPIYKKLYPELTDKCESSLREMIIKTASNIQTYKVYETTWITNIFYNLKFMINRPSISSLENLWKDTGVRAIVVGSGPSLKKDMHYLNELKDKCLIIAAGSSIQALQRSGINPHFVVSIDGSEKNNKVFENVDTSLFPLVFCPPVYYKIVENHKSNIYYAGYQNEEIINYIMGQDFHMPTFLSTSTVTGTAIQIAAFMGVTEILLMGQDLSFTEDEFYAPGVIHYTEVEKANNIMASNKWVKNVEGGFNRTKDSMEILRQDIELLVQIMKLRGVNIVNTSKSGAIIEGTTWMSMEELTPQLRNMESRNFNLSSYILENDYSWQANQRDKVVAKLNDLLSNMDDFNIKIKKLIGSLDKLEKAVSIRNEQKVYNEILNINEIWTSITSEEIFNYLYSYSLGHYINVYMRYVPEIVETKSIIKKGKKIASHLGNLAHKIKEFTPDLQSIVKKTIDRLDF